MVNSFVMYTKGRGLDSHSSTLPSCFCQGICLAGVNSCCLSLTVTLWVRKLSLLSYTGFSFDLNAYQSISSPMYLRHGGPNWGKIVKKWKKIIEEWGKMRKCSFLAHPRLRVWLLPWFTVLGYFHGSLFFNRMHEPTSYSLSENDLRNAVVIDTVRAPVSANSFSCTFSPFSNQETIKVSNAYCYPLFRSAIDGITS